MASRAQRLLSLAVDRLDSALSAAPAPVEEPIRSFFDGRLAVRMDSLYNYITGAGGSGDKGQVARPIAGRNDWLTLRERHTLFRTDGLAKRLVMIPISASMRAGWTLKGDFTEEQLDAIKWAVGVRGVNLDYNVAWAAAWGRLDGTGALLKVTGGRREEPEETGRYPLRGLVHFDGSQAVPESNVYDPLSNRYREPEFWLLNGIRVHASRVIPFRGEERPPSDDYYGEGRYLSDSCLDPVWSALRNYLQTNQAGATVAQESTISILKVGSLHAKQVGDQADTYARRMRQWAQGKSIFGVALLGPNDEYTEVSKNLSGWKDVSNIAREQVSAASGYSQQEIYGDAPSGLNSDGEASAKRDNAKKADWRSEQLYPALLEVYTALLASPDGPTEGYIPDNFDIEFNPLDEPGQMEAADIEHRWVQSFTMLESQGHLSDEGRARFLVEHGWEESAEAVEGDPNPVPEDEPEGFGGEDFAEDETATFDPSEAARKALRWREEHGSARESNSDHLPAPGSGC